MPVLPGEEAGLRSVRSNTGFKCCEWCVPLESESPGCEPVARAHFPAWGWALATPWTFRLLLAYRLTGFHLGSLGASGTTSHLCPWHLVP